MIKGNETTDSIVEDEDKSKQKDVEITFVKKQTKGPQTNLRVVFEDNMYD